jgi:glycosyltransferase involved in cell wall biosynthesis
VRLRLLVPANIRHQSGGNVYNARLTQGLRTLGVEVEVLAVDGSWPDASAKERRLLGSLLGAWGLEAEISSRVVTILDGLIACGAPAEVEYAAAAGHPAWVLLHMPSPSHPDGEHRALRAAAGVICSSSSAADHVRETHGLPAGRVVLPGTDPASVAAGSQPPHIIAVAALLPNKCQLLTVAALASLQDLAWTAALVGTDDADPAYAAQVGAAIASNGLDHRIRLTGELAGGALAEEWHRADLSLLVSRAEAFGMVVTESLAHGIPAIVRAGTGAVEALGLGHRAPKGKAETLPGTAVVLAGPEHNHPEQLAGVIRKWLSDAALRAEWQAAALAVREHLPGWDSAARDVLAILEAPAREASADEASGPMPTATGTAGAQ